MNLGTKFVLALCCLSITFTAGYLAGSQPIADSSTPSSKINDSQARKADELAPVKPAQNDKTAFLTVRTPMLISSPASPYNKEKNKLKNENVEQNIGREHSDIVQLFTQFMAYTATSSDYSDYAKKLDDIRKALVDSNSDLAELLEYFQQIPIDSQESYMLVSILMGLPKEISQAAMLNVMELTLLRSDSSSTADFLELAARTDLKSQSITASLKEIAIFNNDNKHTLRALDMLMPYEFSSTEKQQIREKLMIASQSGEIEERPYYFSQLLRFSDSKQRKQLALDAFKQNDTNLNIKSIIMDAVQSGILDRSEELKETLYHIAKQPEDELQEQAMYTLLYHFDLNQQEYEELNANKVKN